MSKLKDYQDRAVDLMEINQNRNVMFDQMDNYWQNKWQWPKGKKPDWVHTITSSDPHDAILSGTRILSNVDPIVKVQPLQDVGEVLKRAEDMEAALMFLYKQMAGRNSFDMMSSMVQSALQFSMIAGELVYLPYQIEKLEALEANSARAKAALRKGPFTAIIRHPRAVYPVFSDYMLEELLHIRVYTWREFEAFWGKKISARFKREDGDYVVAYEHYGFDEHFIWGKRINEVGDAIKSHVASREVSGHVIFDEPNELGFIPWFITQRGPAFYDDPNERLSPLLKSLYQTKHWDTQNIALSLVMSEIISYAAAPRLLIQSDAPENVEIDYGEPNNPITASPDDKVQPMNTPQIDQAMMGAVDMLSSMIGKETVSNMLQNPEAKSDVPFSAMNLIYQLGASTLNPYKSLTEEAMAEMFRTMLMFIKDKGEPLVTWKQNGVDKGRMITIDPKYYEPAHFYVSVKLTADVPSDKISKVNAAVMLHERLNYTKERALEETGVPDARGILEDWIREDTMLHDHEMDKQKKEMLVQMLAQKVQEMQAQMQQAQMQETQMAPSGVNAQDQAWENIGGQGFNPAMGGTVPATVAPELGREQMTQTTRSGEEMAGGF